MEDFPVKINFGGLAQKQDAAGTLMSINLKPYEKGLRSVLAPKPTHQLSGVIWPFPQVFKLGLNSYVTTKDSIFLISGNALAPLITDVPNANYPWDAAIVGDYKVFINNKTVVVGRDTLEVDDSEKIPTGRSICSVSGQLIIAAPWAYASWNFESVIWSRVGVVDFTLDRSNVSALRFADCGIVLRVLPQSIKTMMGYKSGFIAYGTSGVSSFLHDNLPAGFSLVKLSNIGIYSQLAVSGDINDHFFVSKDKKLYSIKDGVVKELGYQSQLQGAGSEIILSYDTFNKELWVSY